MKPPRGKRGTHLEIEVWMAHLYHIISGQWAWKQCKVCALKWTEKNILPQWKTPSFRA
jgi:hypothetical protein